MQRFDLDIVERPEPEDEVGFGSDFLEKQAEVGVSGVIVVHENRVYIKRSCVSGRFFKWKERRRVLIAVPCDKIGSALCLLSLPGS